MMPNHRSKPTADGKEQSSRFQEAARELGCDESEERFDEALKKVAQHKTKNEPAPERPKKAP